MKTIQIITILCCCNNGILLVITKWKLIERYDLYKREKWPDWCDLCFFFWSAMCEITYININSLICINNILDNIGLSLSCCFISLFIQKKYHENTKIR